jgi:hypothetical protein
MTQLENQLPELLRIAAGAPRSAVSASRIRQLSRRRRRRVLALAGTTTATAVAVTLPSLLTGHSATGVPATQPPADAPASHSGTGAPAAQRPTETPGPDHSATGAPAAQRPTETPGPDHSATGAPAAQRSRDAAETACRRALGSAVVSAAATTVGDVRALSLGPAPAPEARAFPGAADSSPAAWCWTAAAGSESASPGATGSTYTAWAVGPSGAAIKLVSIAGQTATPSGPPVVV